MQNTGTVVITGAQSTIGKHVVAEFTRRNWFVIGSTQSLEGVEKNTNILMLQLDLTDGESIRRFVREVFALGRKIDVLINNAAHVLSGPFEGSSQSQIRNLFEVNFFGTLELTRNFIPHFKENDHGTIVNMSSICGLTTFPMLSLYHASKWALEGFTESIMYELQPFNIRLKLVEPGRIMENEYSAMIEFSESVPQEYQELLDKIHKTNWFPGYSYPADVASVVYQASTDNTDQLRYIIGNDSGTLLSERKAGIENESWFTYIKDIVNSRGDE